MADKLNRAVFQLVCISFSRSFSSVFRGHAPMPPTPRKVRKHFLTRYTVKNWISNLYIFLKSALKMQEMPFQRPIISKWDFKPIYFAQKCPQNAGNAVSVSKNFRGKLPWTPQKLCRHYGLPLIKILATPLISFILL